jgi:hypothetical protein
MQAFVFGVTATGSHPGSVLVLAPIDQSTAHWTGLRTVLEVGRLGTAALTIGFALMIAWTRQGSVKTWRASNVADARRSQPTRQPRTPAPAQISPAARFETGQES